MGCFTSKSKAEKREEERAQIRAKQAQIANIDQHQSAAAVAQVFKGLQQDYIPPPRMQTPIPKMNTLRALGKVDF